jgi:SAP domain
MNLTISMVMIATKVPSTRQWTQRVRYFRKKKHFPMTQYHQNMLKLLPKYFEEVEEDRFILISVVDIDTLKVSELKDELGKRGLSRNGKKAGISGWLKEAMKPEDTSKGNS